MMTFMRPTPLTVRAALHFSRFAEQTMGMPAVQYDSMPRRRWTAAQVRDLIEECRPSPRYELIDGELLVTPSPGYAHQFAVMAFWDALDEYVKTEEIGIVMVSPADLELIEENVTQPDVFVHREIDPADPEKGMTWTDINSLVLAIEIISPSSVRFDRIVKRDYYMDRARISEYWVVDLVAQIVERWTPSRTTPIIDRKSLTWHPPGTKSALVIDLEALFEEIRVASRMPRRI